MEDSHCRPRDSASPPRRPEAWESPLTHSQARLWIGQQLAPDAPLYNTPFTFRIRGPLDEERFERAHQNAETALRSLQSKQPENAS